MAKFFEKKGEFVFPSDIFPKTDSLKLPECPEVVAKRLATQFQSIHAKPEGAQVEWAAKTLFHAEIYGSISKELIPEACKLLESLAKSNSTASYIVGNWYLFGLFGRDEDKQKAKEFYRESIKMKGTRSWYRMGSSAEEKNDIDMAASRYECGAKLQDAACLYRLAIAILKGHFGYPKDVAKAMNLLEKACESADEDFPQPLFLHGMVLLGEVEPGAVAPNREKGFERIQKAASLHFAPALIRMAAAHQQNALPYDSATVMTYLHCVVRQERFLAFQKSTPQFGGDAEVQLSKLFLCGAPPQLKPNEEWAYKFAVAGVECNNPTAQFAVGYYAEVGVYIRRDLELATTMYEQASRNKCEAATQRLAKFKMGASGGVDLQRSATLTRKDHEQALQRTLSQASESGRNVSMETIVHNVGEQLDKSVKEQVQPGQTVKVNLSEEEVPAVGSKNPFNSQSTPEKEKSSGLLSKIPSPTTPTSNFAAINKPPYPESTGKTAPYPSDRPSGQLLPPTSISIKSTGLQNTPKPTINTVDIASANASADVSVSTINSQDHQQNNAPYPVSPGKVGENVSLAAGSTNNMKKSPYPTGGDAIKSPYPLNPSEIGALSLKSTGGPYPDNPKIQKSSVYIPDSPGSRSTSVSPSHSPVAQTPYPRSSSPLRSISSTFSSPSWIKGHARSRSASPERAPSPSRPPMSMMSKLKNKLSISGGIDELAPVNFDQPNEWNNFSSQEPSKPVPASLPNSSAIHYDKPRDQFRSAPAEPLKDAPRANNRQSTFDVSLGSIKEHELGPAGTPSRIVTGVGSRSGTPVQRKAIGTPPALPSRNVSGTPSPDKPVPYMNGISPISSRTSTPVSFATSNAEITSINSNGPNLKRMSASVKRNGHRHTMSMATPAVVNADAPPKINPRVVSSPLKSQVVKPVTPGLKHNGMSFDDMGIQIVVEEKTGPCVIA